MKATYLTLGIVSLVVLAALIYGFILAGSPSNARAASLDSTRVSNISNLKYAIESYYNQHNKLPASLADIDASTYYGSSSTKNDPETSKPYDYKVTSSTSYQLCATFGTDSSAASSGTSLYTYIDPEFKHPKGYHCFDLKVTSYSSTTYTQTKSTTFADTKIDSVTTDYTGTNSANFPYGFFSSNTNEWGLFASTTSPVSVTIKFKTPEKIKSIANTFTTCATSNCYSWSATGLANGKTVNLVASTSTNSEVESKQSVSSTETFSSITITAQKASGGTNYLYWKKITIGYS